MSSHLIQPIELTDWDDVSLGLQCIKHGNTTPKWRTVSTLYNPDFYFDPVTALVGSEDGDKWAKVATDIFKRAGVRYATSCLKSATLQFYLPEVTTFNPDPEYEDVTGQFSFILYINQTEITPVNGYILADNVEVGDPAQTVDYIVDLEALGIQCRPCGNIWSITFGYGASGSVMDLDGLMTMEIVDVTY